MHKVKLFPFFVCFLLACNSQPLKNKIINVSAATVASTNHTSYGTVCKTIHVFVALCDNTYQGIVPVPPKIGNGQDVENNLYWGCSFGIRSYFKNSKNWKLIKKYPIDGVKLERLVFKHVGIPYYMVADAYNGKYIQQCTIDFLKSCAGQIKDTARVDKEVIGINGNAALLAYICHDGLMDFSLGEKYSVADNKKRDAIILACISKKYFSGPLSFTKANPLLWSTGLMSPEAYIRLAAARAYAKYQHCSIKAAMNLLVSGN
jgi:hypothetical protein